MRAIVRRGALAASVITPLAGGAARAADPFPVDPAVLARARGVASLPCAGGTTVDGFAPDEAAPAAWRIAGTLVSVRRREGERIAFVLAPSRSGSADCPVRDVVAMPRGGSLLACGLQDGSVQGIGVHALLPNGRRDVFFWRADGDGGLRRQGSREGDEDYESDTGQLICALPDAIP